MIKRLRIAFADLTFECFYYKNALVRMAEEGELVEAKEKGQLDPADVPVVLVRAFMASSACFTDASPARCL